LNPLTQMINYNNLRSRSFFFFSSKQMKETLSTSGRKYEGKIEKIK